MERISELLFKHLSGTLDPVEREELMDWAGAHPDNLRLLEQVNDESRLDADLERWFAIPKRALEDDARLEAEVARHERRVKAGSIRRWLPYAAAVLLAGILIGFYTKHVFIREYRGSQPVPTASADVVPGSDKAVLTLGDGSELILGSGNEGNIADQNGVKIIQLDGGKLSYQDAGAADEVLYNTITTPRGGQYQVVLPDGSTVRLNAASSLRYPTRFVGAAREVYLTGQAYFEVAASETDPFIVKTGMVDVAALGTRFDIMAYPEEKELNTTLVQGSVRVSEQETGVLLKPGQQASRVKGEKLSVREVNLEEAVAWTNGLFYFGGVPVAYIMRQIQRWYDVEVEYRGDVSSVQLSGFISRKKDIKDLLDALEDTGDVTFKLEGRNVIVQPGKR